MEQIPDFEVLMARGRSQEEKIITVLSLQMWSAVAVSVHQQLNLDEDLDNAVPSGAAWKDTRRL